LCPKKLADNWLNYNRNLKTNIFAKDRFNYDVLCHTDLSRTSGESFGTPLNRINWGNYDLVVIDESHNFRNNDAYKDKETRYQKLMNKVIKEGVKTKVLMLSATPVNNRFTDLRNQLALAYEGDSENLSKKLKHRQERRRNLPWRAGRVQCMGKLPPEERTARAILDSLDFDFFELLDSVTIARSRKHIQTFYDTKDIGQFPERRKPLVVHCPLTAAVGRDGLQRDLRAAVPAQAGGVRPSATSCPAASRSTKRSTTPRSAAKAPQASRPRKEPAGPDDGQPAQAAGKLGRVVPADFERLAPQSPSTLAKIAAFNQSGARPAWVT
jgi:hypothetical protein